MTRPVEEKNTGPVIFHVYTTNFKILALAVLEFPTAIKFYGWTDGQTDGRTVPNQYAPKLGAKQMSQTYNFLFYFTGC